MDNTNNYIIAPICMDTIMELVSNVVMRYVSKSSIPKREKEDVEMAIIEKILKQQDKINASFQNRSNIKTYYIAVINRMCCEVIRNESKHWYSVSDLEIERVAERESLLGMKTDRPLIIKKEIKRLSNIMLFFNEDRYKILIFLKFLFDIPISENEVQKYCKGNIKGVRPIFNRDESMSQADIYNVLAHITNRVEDKDVKGDAIRMWLNKNIELILKRLNDHDESNHCRESLKILLEMEDSQFQSSPRESKSSFWTINKQKDER